MLAIKEEKLSLDELRDYASYFLERNYNVTLEIPITQNNRLTRSLGRYIHTIAGEPKGIQLSGRLLRYGTNNVIIDVLKHELIHYALHILGKPYKDGQPYFENELRKHGSPSTNTKRVGIYYVIQCTRCENKSLTKTKSVIKNIKNYRSRCCHSDLIHVGNVIYDGETKVYV